MTTQTLRPEESPLRLKDAVLISGAAVAAFQLAYTFNQTGFLIVGFLAGLFAISRLGSVRLAFYFGLATGLGAYGPQLAFFWNIFGPAAIALWVILAFWVALFVALSCACRRRLGPFWAAALAPFLWTGLEYFRCELYPLRFSWLNVGYAFAESPQLFTLSGMGIYGIGFALTALIGLVALLPCRQKLWLGSALGAVLGILTNLPSQPSRAAAPGTRTVQVTGLQMEFPAELEVPLALSESLRRNPGTDLFVLSEYTFDGPLPPRTRRWCADHGRYLVAGGKEPAGSDQFYNTAYVVGPDGAIVLQQAKSVPIQFFKDGLPAPEQRLWDSPWGRIGLAICYDLSYTRVMDRLVAPGAQGLIVPTMDLAEWGRHEHDLHARIGPVRAAEYGLPLLRVASSGISQLVNARGRVLARAPFPGERASVTGELALGKAGLVPLDRTLAWQCTCLTALLFVCFLSSPKTDLPWRRLTWSRPFLVGTAVEGV
jgi:apolipoprotein N-acyltransferase